MSAATTPTQPQRARSLRNLPAIFALSILALLVSGPVLFAAVGAFIPSEVVTGGRTLSVSDIGFANFATALSTAPLVQQLVNSALVTLAQTLLQFITSALAAYAIVFGRLRRAAWVFGFFLLTMMIPSETTIIANYLTIRSLGIFDTLLAVFLPFGTSVWAIFLFRQVFASFPREIHEAASVDGVGPWRFLVSFLLPLNQPIVMTVLLTSAIGAWNGYMWPLLVTESPASRTVQVGVAALSDEVSVDVGTVLAGLFLVSLPMILLVIAGQKFLTRGLTEGAVK